MAHKLLTVGHDVMAKHRHEEFFTYENDCDLRSGTLADRRLSALQMRWIFLEQPLVTFPVAKLDAAAKKQNESKE